jgi:hypothetical protein
VAWRQPHGDFYTALPSVVLVALTAWTVSWTEPLAKTGDFRNFRAHGRHVRPAGEPGKIGRTYGKEKVYGSIP